MLSRSTIETLINLRLSDCEIREHLLALTPELLDVETIATFVQVIKATLSPEDRLLEEALTGVVDCSGTGGSGLPHFNTSTTVAFVLAAGGLKVVKAGNRAMTSASGSFDLLSGLGFPVGLPSEAVPRLLEETGVVFLFAPQYYPVLARFTSVRRQLDVKTVFNYLGPLLNPAAPEYRLMGVSDGDMHDVIAAFLSCEPRTKRALVATAESGLDEIAALGPSRLSNVEPGRVESRTFHAHDSVLGLAEGSFTPAENVDTLHAHDSILGLAEGSFTPAENVDTFLDLVAGRGAGSVAHRLVCLNAGAAFEVCGKATSIESGAELAARLLVSGAVRDIFERAKEAYGKFLG